MAAAKPTHPVSPMTLLITVFTIILAAPTPSNALIPFSHNPLWDLMLPSAQDPFRILEQTPLSVPRSPLMDSSSALALARADWKETPTAHHISLDVPGIPRHLIKIEVEEGRVLRISGERRGLGADDGGVGGAATQEEEKGDGGDKWHRAERVSGRFWRQFRLPGNADLEAIKARLENGVLEITVPKLAEEKRRAAKVIDIAAAAGSSSSSSEDIINASSHSHSELK